MTADPTTRLGVRELRANLASVLQRAAAGERVVILHNGVPMAQLGPVAPPAELSVDDLVAAGLIDAPVTPRRRQPQPPVALAVDQNARDALDDLRGRQ